MELSHKLKKFLLFNVKYIIVIATTNKIGPNFKVMLFTIVKCSVNVQVALQSRVSVYCTSGLKCRMLNWRYKPLLFAILAS